MAGPMIAVSVEFPLAVQDVDGRWFRIEGTDATTFIEIPASAYRRNAWMGLFSRPLRKVRGLGREFWVDTVRESHEDIARRIAGQEARRPAWVPVAPPEARQSGCGCGRRTS